MAGEGLAQPMKDLPLAGLVEQFLADAARSCTAETVQWYRIFLSDFADRYPKLKPAEIAPRHVRAWVNGEHPRPWKQTTHRSAITILKRLLNWAVANKLLAENPVKDLERPAATIRVRVLTREERATILAQGQRLLKCCSVKEAAPRRTPEGGRGCPCWESSRRTA